jgi:hypothetical protein
MITPADANLRKTCFHVSGAVWVEVAHDVYAVFVCLQEENVIWQNQNSANGGEEEGQKT